MEKFKIGDKFAFIKKTSSTPDVLNTGRITKGPFKIDRIDHYQVKWDKQIPNVSYGQDGLTSTIDSPKYQYLKIN